MPREHWFPLKHQMQDGTRLGRLLYSGPNWQIFRVDRNSKVLIVRLSLAEQWIASGLLPDTALGFFSFGDKNFVSLPSGASQRLEPVEDCGLPSSKADGLAFALSLRETRKIDSDSPLHDAIYAERYSRLLPTWSVSEVVEDEEVLGRWLTGGVSVPVTSFRRLSSLLGWLDQGDVREFIEAAGLQGFQKPEVVRTRTKPQERQETTERKAATNQSELQDGGSAARCRFRLSGRPALEVFFNEHVIDIVKNADRYKALGIDFPTAIVLHGPPGCGKTFAVERLAEYLDWPIFYIDSNSVGSSYIHETSRKVGEIFDKAADATPSMIVIDEMESYLSDRQLNASTGLHHVEEVAEFLRRIPEASKRHVLVVGMTNRLEMIDSAILRRGRFDHILEVGMPSAEEVSELIKSLLQKVPLCGEIDTKDIVRSLTGRALSDSAFVVREAARLAVRADKTELDEELLLAALSSLPSLKPERRSMGFIQD